MAIPIAAIIAAGAQTAMQIARNSLQRPPLKSTTGVTGAGMARAAAAGGGGFIAQQILNAGGGNIVPMLPTPSQFKAALPGPVMKALQTQQPGGTIPTFTTTVFARRKYRRMNPCNVKALRRAGRRVDAFVRLAKSLVSMPSARAKNPIKRARRRR